MTIDDVKKEISSDRYSFLRKNEHLGRNIILLGLGGSHAYGTNTETSDLDIRGVATLSSREILTGSSFDQVTNSETDTTIYAFNKMIHLLCNANPNVIEILGLKQEHYLFLSPAGEELLKNKKLFLSRIAINSFGGYANAQLQRLNNKAVRAVGQEERERHILNTIKYASSDFPRKYFPADSGKINLYIDKSDREEYDTEIYMDLDLKHYPLRDWTSMWSEMKDIVRSYSKIGKRNQNAASHGKLGKHMMHLIRLYYMVFDILEKEEIITYRENEHDFLMDIRNGSFLGENDQVRPEFFELIDELDKRLKYDKENTSLPEIPDYNKIYDLMCEINKRVILSVNKHYI